MYKKRDINLSHYYIDLNELRENEFTDILIILTKYHKYSVPKYIDIKNWQQFDYLSVKGAYITLGQYNNLIGEKKITYNQLLKYDLSDRINGFCNYL